MPKKPKPEPTAIVPAADTPSTPATTTPTGESALSTRSTPGTKRKSPRNHRELAEAIFEECDAVTVGRELLSPNNERVSNSVKARTWETLVDFLFGKPAAASNPSAAEPKVRIIWDLPGPPREKDKP